jgi:hypothetical protein
MRPGEEGRQEERQPLDVIRVGVADEQVGADRTGPREGDPELARARTAIEDEQRSVVGARLDARRVAAVASGLGTRRGDRPSDTPEADTDGSVYTLTAGSRPRAVPG